jgi:hypothetical protein
MSAIDSNNTTMPANFSEIQPLYPDDAFVAKLAEEYQDWQTSVEMALQYDTANQDISPLFDFGDLSDYSIDNFAFCETPQDYHTPPPLSAEETYEPSGNVYSLHLTSKCAKQLLLRW